MTQRLGIRSGECGVTVVISGDIDLANRHEIVHLVRDAIRPETTCVALDMSTVDFIDCAGLGGLLEARHLAAMEGCDLRVVSMTPRVRRLLELSETLPFLT